MQSMTIVKHGNVMQCNEEKFISFLIPAGTPNIFTNNFMIELGRATPLIYLAPKKIAINRAVQLLTTNFLKK